MTTSKVLFFNPQQLIDYVTYLSKSDCINQQQRQNLSKFIREYAGDHTPQNNKEADRNAAGHDCLTNRDKAESSPKEDDKMLAFTELANAKLTYLASISPHEFRDLGDGSFALHLPGIAKSDIKVTCLAERCINVYVLDKLIATFDKLDMNYRQARIFYRDGLCKLFIAKSASAGSERDLPIYSLKG